MSMKPRFTRTSRLFPTLLAFAILFIPNAKAQFDTAAVLGTVRDPSGAPVSNAKITVKNAATGITAVTTTDPQGDYVFPSVRIGTYEIRAESAGFSVAVASNVSVTVNARQRVDLSLQVGQVSETVSVVAEAPLLEADSSDKGQVISQRQIVNLPIRGRTYSSLALLAPGVRESQSGNSGDITTRREGSYNVNGLRSVYNNFLLDGVDNNFYGTTNQGYSNQASQPSPDSVAEFRMSVNAYSAEYGRTGGAVMNVSTRSGSNEYHGALWNYFQNTALNATGFFKPAENRKPQTNRNQFGFVFGGRIIRDRTFFFADYEGSRWIQNPFSLTSIPSLDHRRGILNADVRVPFDFTASDGRRITAGTTIAAGQPVPMTEFARRVLAELPQPNRPGGGAFGIANNFGGFSLNRLFEDKGAIKVDHRVTDRISAFARYTHRHQSIEQPGLITGFSGGNATGLLDTFNQQGIGGLTFSASPSSIIEYRFAVTRLGMDRLPMSIGGPSMRELFGITGLPEGPRIQGGVTPQDITGFARIGRQSTSPQAQFPTTLNSRFNYNKILGSHNLKTGHEWLHLGILVDDTNPLYGIDAYGGGFSRPAAGATNTAYSLADFYFGARSIYQLATQKIADTRQWANWFYIQDDWKVNTRLTLNLGVRYEITTPMYEANNEAANFDLSTRQLVLAKDGSLEDRALRKMDWNNFAPRVGFAYQLTDKTVIRSGYGLGYNYWNRMASAEVLGTNAPFVTRFSRANSSLNVNNICTGNEFANCFRPTWQGYPANLPSNVILYMQRDMPWSYIQNWHFTVQQSLTPNTLVDVAYVGNRGVKLPLLGDLNQARPITVAELAATGTPLATLDARRPIQGFGNITAVVPTAFSSYNALQFRFEHRGGDLTVLNSFTYSKAIDNVGQVLEGSNGGSPNPQDFNNPNADKGRSSFDQRFNNTASIVYAVPFGHGKKYGSQVIGILDGIAGGWEASSIITLQSGQPLNLRYADNDGRLSDGQADFLGNVALRPNIIDASAGILAADGVRTHENYFDRTNFAIPSPTAPFGNLGRNPVYGYALYQVNLMIQKNFAMPFINESSRLTFRAEAFNLFNTTNFTAPNTDLRSANFGRVSSTFDPRAVQLALRLAF
jgi:hypothetical protein